MTSIGSLGFEDSFGKLIADNTRNIGDIASHFPFNAERWRYRRRDATSGGLTREFVQYGETTGFTDTVDSFIIDPTTADYIAQIRTAERYQYVVGYTTSVSFAFQTNQSLAAGDKVIVGVGDPDIENNMANADGWFLEFLPSLADNECYFNEYRGGTLVSNGGSNNLVQLEKSVTDWRRMEIEFNWYGVGSASLTETYTDTNGEQRNVKQAEITGGDGKGTETANKKMSFSIRGGGNGTTLETGSIAIIGNGDIQEIFREKGDRREFTIGTADTWIPFLAVRRDPTREPVSLSLADTSVLRYSATSDEVEIQVKNFDETKVAFTGTDSWGTPDSLTPTNTTLEARTDLDQIADQTGALTANTTTPGGYQIFRVEFSPTGDQAKNGTTTTGQGAVKRKIYDGDYAVFLAKSPVTGETFTINYLTDESW